ncbi:hypothetical protein NC652_022347 [Populus alba x Populus x berolinensis]|nr:hypothetical protein NC652_022347 [Populus alba x Populus x berolinensis]
MPAFAFAFAFAFLTLLLTQGKLGKSNKKEDGHVIRKIGRGRSKETGRAKKERTKMQTAKNEVQQLNNIVIRFNWSNIFMDLVRRNMTATSKYTGMLQATKDIFREEGLPVRCSLSVYYLSMDDLNCIVSRAAEPRLYTIFCFYPRQLLAVGLLAWQCSSFTHGYAIHRHTICGVAQIKNICCCSSKTEDHIQLSPYLSYISGALAGCTATVGSYPFDLLRTILASQGEPKVYPTMRSAFVDITRTRGFRGLYAGLSPTLVEIVPYAGLQFGTYDTFKRWTMGWNHHRSSTTSFISTDDSLSSFQLFVCGLAAGTCAKLVCHPLDVVKKRFQIEGLQRHPRYGARVEHHAYKNMFDALSRILQMEGWAGLYKGIVPSTVKAAPAGAVTFLAYEFTSDWLESIST